MPATAGVHAAGSRCGGSAPRPHPRWQGSAGWKGSPCTGLQLRRRLRRRAGTAAKHGWRAMGARQREVSLRGALTARIGSITSKRQPWVRVRLTRIGCVLALPTACRYALCTKFFCGEEKAGEAGVARRRFGQAWQRQKAGGAAQGGGAGHAVRQACEGGSTQLSAAQAQRQWPKPRRAPGLEQEHLTGRRLAPLVGCSTTAAGSFAALKCSPSNEQLPNRQSSEKGCCECSRPAGLPSCDP